MQHDIFISFSFRDQPVAEHIVNLLSSCYGISSWICTQELLAGDRYKDLIPEAIDCAKAVVFIQSESSVESREVPKEIGIAFDAEKPIVPFRVDAAPLKGALRYDLHGVQYIDATVPSFEERVAELAEILQVLLGGKKARAEAEVKVGSTSQQNGAALCSMTVGWSEIFFGREKEFQAIEEAFAERNTVFLRGMGGIGKSELARQYYRRHREEYDTVIFARYTDSLAVLLADDSVFHITGMARKTRSDGQKQTDEEYAEEKLKVIRAAADRRTLIILDNFDVTADPMLEELAQDNQYRLLVTSRCEPERGRYYVLPVKELDDEALRDMVIEFANPEVTMIEPDDPAFPRLLEQTGRHTLTLELIARFMEEKCIDDVGEMTDLLERQNLAVLESTGNGARTDAIRNILRMTQLSVDEKNFLRYLALMPQAGIDQKMFRSWCGDVYTARPRLAGLSLIRLDRVTRTISLHPIVRHVVFAELKPTVENCAPFLQAYMEDISHSWSWPIGQKLAAAACGDNMMTLFGEVDAENYDLYYAISILKNFVCTYQQVMPLHHKLYEFAISSEGEDSYRAGLTAFRAGWFCQSCSTSGMKYWMEERAYPVLRKYAHRALTEYPHMLTNLGTMYIHMYSESGDGSCLEQAEQWLEKSMEANLQGQAWAREDGNSAAEKNLQEKYAGVLMSQADLAQQRRQYEKASELLEDARNRLDPADLTDLTWIRLTLAKNRMEQGFYAEAVTELEQVKKAYAQVFSETNDYYLNTTISAADCYKALGETDKARENYEKATEIAEKLLTEDHPIRRKLAALKAGE